MADEDFWYEIDPIAFESFVASNGLTLNRISADADISRKILGGVVSGGKINVALGLRMASKYGASFYDMFGYDGSEDFFDLLRIFSR